MPFVRNPFKRQDENARPAASPERANSFTVSSVGDKDSAEYKLSEINDSGICLPPSPPVEKKSFWGVHTNSSRSTTTSHRNLVNEKDQFSISRESFDSYRRSFDISGRSPVMRPNEYTSRASLDSRTFCSPVRGARPPPVPLAPLSQPSSSAAAANSRAATNAVKEEAQAEQDFEDVGLNDDVKPAVKKRGLFARLTDSTSNADAAAERPASSHEKPAWHHFGVGTRKRGQSGQGAELGSYPDTERVSTPKPVAV